MLEKAKYSWQAWVIPCIVILIWFVLGATGRLNAGVFPTIGEVWDAFLYLTGKGLLTEHIIDSLSRVLVGFGMAIVVGGTARHTYGLDSCKPNMVRSHTPFSAAGAAYSMDSPLFAVVWNWRRF